jgi:mono/diheme cytochrome c family protein
VEDQSFAQCAALDGTVDFEFECSAIDECNPVGQALYIAECQGCHGVDGAGGTFSNVQGKSAQEIEDAIMDIGPMMTPDLEALTAEQIDAIAAFLDM